MRQLNAGGSLWRQIWRKGDRLVEGKMAGSAVLPPNINNSILTNSGIQILH